MDSAQMNKKSLELMDRYAKVRKLLVDLETERRRLEPKILSHIDETTIISCGVFVPKKVNKYQYSDHLMQVEAEAKNRIKEFNTEVLEPIKKSKKIEELDGTATAIESQQLSFKASKEN